MKYILILLILITLFSSCKEKDVFSVRLPNKQVGLISKKVIKYNTAVQLRYSKDKTLFFSSLENMLKYVEKHNWNLFKAGVKKAYVTDYDKSKNKKSELWVNTTVAFYTYIKNEDGKRILVAFNTPKTVEKYINNILPNNWKHIKPIKKDYFTFIELIRELRASKKGKK